MERKCKSGLMKYCVALENYSTHKRHTALVWNSRMDKLWHIQPTMSPLTHYAPLNHSYGLPRMPISGLPIANTPKNSTREGKKLAASRDTAGDIHILRQSQRQQCWPKWIQQ